MKGVSAEEKMLLIIRIGTRIGITENPIYWGVHSVIHKMCIPGG